MEWNLDTDKSVLHYLLSNPNLNKEMLDTLLDLNYNIDDSSVYTYTMCLCSNTNALTPELLSYVLNMFGEKRKLSHKLNQHIHSNTPARLSCVRGAAFLAGPLGTVAPPERDRSAQSDVPQPHRLRSARAPPRAHWPPTGRVARPCPCLPEPTRRASAGVYRPTARSVGPPPR